MMSSPAALPALLLALLAASASSRTLLLLDPSALSSSFNISLGPGSPELLASFTGGIGGGAYAGWGYPSVVRGQLPNGSAGFLMLYSGPACAAPGCWGQGPLFTFLAQSLDGVAWEPVAVPSAPPGAPPGALFTSGEVGAVLDDAGGRGVAAGERYKLLRPDTSIEVSEDGVSWARWRYNWTRQSVDPGFHALRAAANSSTVLITARPQALRPQGRHAGAIVGPSGWADLGSQLATASEPLDSLLYRFSQQIYGLPAFDYAAVLGAGGGGGLPPALSSDSEEGSNFVGFVWRLQAPNGETGSITSALAFSRDGRGWAPAPAAPVPVQALALDTDLPAFTYQHIYGSWASPAAGAAACNTACRNDSSSCAAWAYVAPGAGRGPERCCLKRDLSPPVPAPGIVSGFRSDLAAEGSAPLAALPPLFPLPVQPSATAYRQFYPKSVLAVGGRLLLYASTSSTLHGDSAPNASAIAVYALRVDGFAAAAAPLQGSGSVVTAVLDWAGGEAALNVLCGAAAGASVRVAALQGGLPLPGYSLEQADAAPEACDELAWQPSWGSGARGLSALAGLSLQLQVQLSAGAQLFAVRGNFSQWL
jgi:hypothetical protein